MARYRGTMQGMRGEASRLGSPSSGLRSSTNGWDIGIDVVIGPRQDHESEDEVSVYLTGGSSRKCKSIFLGDFTVDNKDGIHLKRLREGDI